MSLSSLFLERVFMPHHVISLETWLLLPVSSVSAAGICLLPQVFLIYCISSLRMKNIFLLVCYSCDLGISESTSSLASCSHWLGHRSDGQE